MRRLYLLHLRAWHLAIAKLSRRRGRRWRALLRKALKYGIRLAIEIRKDLKMSDPNAETVQNFLKGLNARIILLEELVDRCAGLLGLGPVTRGTGDQIARSGTIGSIQDSIEEMTQNIRDIAGKMGDILDELERI